MGRNDSLARGTEQIAVSRQDAAQGLMHRANWVFTQTTKDKNMLSALHSLGVECLVKGEARIPYEFSV